MDTPKEDVSLTMPAARSAERWGVLVLGQKGSRARALAQHPVRWARERIRNAYGTGELSKAGRALLRRR